ncbi:MAG: class F sortase [Patescibacteria group bacterium]|nr:class F sortase [Patescibacteria group bacterium]
MSEKPLLLSSAKSGALIKNPSWPWGIPSWFFGLKPLWRLLIMIVWALFALVGLINILGHLGGGAEGSSYSMSNEALAVGPGFAFMGASATSSGGIIPSRLEIPSIGVSASVEQVGLNADGSVGTPSSFGTVAWYKGGPEPGAPGNAVIDGHVNNALTSAGVFEHLNDLHLGDTIIVADSSGQVRTFSVTSEQVYPVNAAPTTQIFSLGGPSQLVLITCDGAWDNGAKEFNERLVVYAALQP